MKISKVIAILVSVLCWGSIKAQIAIYDYYYEIINNQEVKIVGVVNPSEYDYSYVYIPRVIKIEGKEYKVTCIGPEVFSGMPIENIEFPSGITEIQDKAFYDCKLTTLTIPENIKYIGEKSFANNVITSLKFPSGEDIRISKEAFVGCDIKTVCMNRSGFNLSADAFSASNHIIFDSYSANPYIDGKSEWMEKSVVIIPKNLKDNYLDTGLINDKLCSQFESNAMGSIMVGNYKTDDPYKTLFGWWKQGDYLFCLPGTEINLDFSSTSFHPDFVGGPLPYKLYENGVDITDEVKHGDNFFFTFNEDTIFRLNQIDLGLENINGEESSEIFTINGYRLNESRTLPDNSGIYIIRKGNSFKKVVKIY